MFRGDRKLDSKILKHLFTLEHLLVDHQTVWKQNRNLMGCGIVYLIVIKIRKFFKADARHCHLLHNQRLLVLYFLVVSLQRPINHILIMVRHKTVNSLNSCSTQLRDCKGHNTHGDCDHFGLDKTLAYLVYLLYKLFYANSQSKYWKLNFYPVLFYKLWSINWNRLVYFMKSNICLV
jgi:hypothetical protein